jgi:hypothetical protein
MGWPVQIAAGAPLCPTERSARAKTFDVVAAVLFPLAGSFVEDDTTAVFKIAPPSAGAVTVRVIGAAAVTPSAAIAHVTGPVPVQAQPVPVEETKAVPAGSVSVTDTELACEGPAFETFNVYVSVVPAPTGSGDAEPAIARSACVA